MTTAWRKVARELRQERTRTVLVVSAMAIGIAGFAAVLTSYAVLTRERDESYRSTNPASTTLRTDAIDDALVAALPASLGLAEVEVRRVVTGHLKAGPAEWRALTLFVIKDYADIRVSKIKTQKGAWPPAAGEILMERDALQVARAGIGDTVIVKAAGGREQTLRVSGSVHDVGQAQARMENGVYGYIVLDTLPLLGEEPYFDQLKIVVAENALDETHVRRVASNVKEWLESRGHPVHRVDVPAPGKHPHADIMGLLLLTMAAFGLLVLVLSGILVLNLLLALLASQVRQVGILKAIGASRGQVARLYFGQALLLGAAAILVALPPGILGGRMLSEYLAVFLNFDVNTFFVPVWVYLLVAGVGLVVPLLAAAYPIAKGTGVSVREAISDFGVGPASFGTTRFERALAGMGGISRPLLLAVRNTFRRRLRLALTLITLSAGGLFFMSAFNVRSSLIHTLDRLFASRQFDLTVNLDSIDPFEKALRAARNTPGVVRAEGWITAEGTLPSSTDAPAVHAGGTRFSMVALPPEPNMLDPDIVRGRDLQKGETHAVVINSALAAKAPRLEVGREAVFRIGPDPVPLRVVGIAREPFSPATAYVPRALFEDRGHIGAANSLRLVLEKKDAPSIAGVRSKLDQNLEREGLHATGSAAKADRRYAFDQHMLMIYVFLLIMAAVLAGVGGLGLMTTMSLNVLERRREMGVLRAIGAPPRTVWLVIVAEGLTVGVLSWLAAAIVAWPVSRALGDVLVRLMFRSDLDFVFEPAGLLGWLGISLVLAAASSLVPAWHASRCPVREAIGYE